jgi:hypothetical protein
MEPGYAAPTENRMRSLLPVIVSLISGVVVAAVIAVATLLDLGAAVGLWAPLSPISEGDCLDQDVDSLIRCRDF